MPNRLAPSTTHPIAMDSFRRINVDKYDEDTLLEDELIDVDTRSPAELAGLAKQRANDVRGLIGR